MILIGQNGAADYVEATLLVTVTKANKTERMKVESSKERPVNTQVHRKYRIISGKNLEICSSLISLFQALFSFSKILQGSLTETKLLQNIIQIFAKVVQTTFALRY